MEQAPRTGRPDEAPVASSLSAPGCGSRQGEEQAALLRRVACPAPAGTAPPEEVPEVADAVGARATGLRRVAERIHEAVGGELAGALRAHAGAVDALAAHLRHAGTGGDAPAHVPPTS